MNLWFGGYHYGVSSKDKWGEQVELFRDLKSALKQAKFLLYNRDDVIVIDLQNSSFTGNVLFRSVNKKRLVKSKT